MDGFPTPRLPLPLALAVVLLVLGALSLPPLQLIQRSDRALYDLWAAATPLAAPEEIVLVRLEDPAWHHALLNASRHGGAKLLISTLAQPPAGGRLDAVMGPVALASENAMVLRETNWPKGGHLWFPQDIDGVIRQDWPIIDGAVPIPSLALAGANMLLGLPQAPVLAAREVILGGQKIPVDRQGRRWLRFYGSRPFTELTPSEILAAPELLADKVIIAGGESAGRHWTPVGKLTTRELLAHALAGYWQREAVTTGAWSYVAGWAAAGAVLLAIGVLPLGWPGTLVLPLLGAAGLLAASAFAFVAGGLWLAVSGPVALTMLGGAYAAWSRQASDAPAPPAEESVTDLTEARRLVARGRLHEAWDRYRALRLHSAILGELYQLGCALQREGSAEMAVDVFHRIAQVDAGYRDVTRHLVQARDTGRSPRPTAASTPRPTMLGRYELLEAIGQGAMGTVFLGRDPTINRIVAIKAIDLTEAFDPEYIDEARDRFVREAETAGRLNHPDIVTVFDAGEKHNIAYIAMEFLTGRHLSEHGDPDTLLPTRQALELGARIADALHYAHRHNVVHRDIKPANIMYDSASDTLKITDFGIARLMDVSRTRTGIVLGTPSFMSPEQLEGENVNGHTDLFALGVSLYQLLTGRLPFRGTSMTQLMFVIANEPHPPVTAIRPDLPECLDALIDTALAKHPASRFESGAKMAQMLRETAREVS